MSSAHADRIKLATGATTILRPPIGRGKSITGTAAFWSALPELSSRDQLDRNGPEQGSTTATTATSASASGGGGTGSMPPIPGAGPVPWRDAVTVTSSTSSKAQLLHPSGPARTSTRKAILIAAPSSKALGSDMANGSGGGGGSVNSGAVSIRRNGVVSAPITVSASGAAAAAAASVVADGVGSGADDDRQRLPAIGSASRSASGITPGLPAVAAALPSALKGAIRRSLVSLPSIRCVAGAAGAAADGGDGGDDTSSSDDEPPPIIVTYVQPRPLSGGKRAVRRALSRPAVRVTVGSVVIADDGGGSEDAGTETQTPGSAAAASAASGRGAVLLRGIRRLLGKESSLGAAAAARASIDVGPGVADTANAAAVAPAAAHISGSGGVAGGGGAAAGSPTDDTVRQDDTTLSLYPQRSSTSVAVLTYEHVRELERVNRIRSSLLGGDPNAAVREAGGEKGSAGAAGGGGGGVTGALSPLAAQPSNELLEEARSLRSGKSFTQRAMEDPRNPAFKTAKQLLAVQEKLSYMDDHAWRERAAQLVAMERPLLAADNWKL